MFDSSLAPAVLCLFMKKDFEERYSHALDVPPRPCFALPQGLYEMIVRARRAVQERHRQ
jgi:hypothetical protein